MSERRVYRCSKGHVWEVREGCHKEIFIAEYVDGRPVELCLRCLTAVLGKVERVE